MCSYKIAIDSAAVRGPQHTNKVTRGALALILCGCLNVAFWNGFGKELGGSVSHQVASRVPKVVSDVFVVFSSQTTARMDPMPVDGLCVGVSFFGTRYWT
eukprot:6165794-Amphidinium_carterae.1